MRSRKGHVGGRGTKYIVGLKQEHVVEKDARECRQAVERQTMRAIAPRSRIRTRHRWRPAERVPPVPASGFDQRLSRRSGNARRQPVEICCCRGKRRRSGVAQLAMRQPASSDFAPGRATFMSARQSHRVAALRQQGEQRVVMTGETFSSGASRPTVLRRTMARASRNWKDFALSEIAFGMFDSRANSPPSPSQARKETHQFEIGAELAQRVERELVEEFRFARRQTARSFRAGARRKADRIAGRRRR